MENLYIKSLMIAFRKKLGVKKMKKILILIIFVFSFQIINSYENIISGWKYDIKDADLFFKECDNFMWYPITGSCHVAISYNKTHVIEANKYGYGEEGVLLTPKTRKFNKTPYKLFEGIYRVDTTRNQKNKYRKRTKNSLTKKNL